MPALVPLAPPRKTKRVQGIYAECTCDDFLWNRHKNYTQEHFGVRWGKARRVMVAKHTDFLIPPEMTDDRDNEQCVWRDELGILHFKTITRDKTNRSHEVTLTVGGQSCDWVCKHIISAARWVFRHKFCCRHVHVCWEGDLYVVKAIGMAEHQKGGLLGTEKAELYSGCFIIGWDVDKAKLSNLFKEGEKNESREITCGV
jgi:hypothetical protein